jgi:hypothetical protein
MVAKLWYMNADFEIELGAMPGVYRYKKSIAEMNRKLAPNLLWLATPGDALLLEQPWPAELCAQACARGVELVDPAKPQDQSARIFTPWGWTPSAAAAGMRSGAIVMPIPYEIVTRINSKLFSHAIEQELGIVLPGTSVANGFTELADAVARACPTPDTKWVIKSPLGFAARDRVLGRGPKLVGPPAIWSERRFAHGEQLIFQPWLQVKREYGVVMEIQTNGKVTITGVSDMQTNGAGTSIGYLLGREIAPYRREELESVANLVGERLYREGYHGPAGVDALEHTGGLHPLLEINARYTMGFVAVAVERELHPSKPVFWTIK